MNKRSQLCRYYGIFILLIISLVLVFSSFSIGEEPPDDGSLDTSKGQRYGKDSDIIPNLDGSGGVIIIQQGRNIYEEGNWKRLKDAKSLHNQNFGWAYINKDPDYEIETENSEYNYTHIKKLKLKTDLDGGIPFKIDNVQVLTVFNELEIENYYIGNIFAHNFTFGEHSTTIILQTADTKNLEDAHTFDSSNYGTATSMYFGVADTTLFRSYNKFNITQCDDCGIPSGQVILNANITFRIVTAFKEVGYKDLGAYHVYTQNWNEHSITRDNEPCGTNFDQSAECNLTVLNTINTNDLVASTIRGWNITPSFAQAYNDGDNNFTIAMKAVSESTGEGNYVTVATKEYATEQLHRPKLTVEYESPADTGFPYFTSHLNNQTYPYYNENINVSVNVIDDSDIDFIIFSTNDSGSWANHSFEPTATTSHFNYTILRVASSKDTLVGYAWFANDTGSNMNRTLNQSDDSYFFFRVQNTAPTITSAELNNTATVYTDTPVNCTIDFTDADAGDTLTRYSKFYSNDVLINGIWKDNTTILTTYAGLDKGDVLGCAGIVGDGTNNATSWIASTTNATILNSAPVMATAVINDTTPYTNEPVNCSVTATDEDADTFTFYYKWYDNYVTNNSIFESLPILDLSTSGWDKSNDVGCLALVNDGTTNSSWFVSTINATILNSVPIVATAVINDTTPYTNEPVNCSMTASDADIDTTTFYYRWYNDYATNGSIFTSPILDLSATGWDKTDKVGCVVISGDGTGNSTSFVSTTNATIQNTAPTHTTPILNATDHPLNKTTANLTGYDQGGSDADSDDIVFNYRWFKDDTLNATRFIDNSSLVLYLPFDYNHTFSDNITYDYRGENDGTVTDALFNSTGRLNGAYEFDGDGDYINVSDADFRFNTGDFSVAFWGKRTTTGEVQFMLDKRDGNLDGWAFLMEADNTVTASLDLVEVTSTNIMPNNKWIHIVAVYDRSDVITLYFNGASEATSASISGDNMDTTKSFVIGKPSYFSGANEFTGTIDEVLIYNRSLSALEIQQHYWATVNNYAVMNSSQTKRGDSWKIEMTPYDKEEAGVPLNSTAIMIQNTRPTIASAELNHTGTLYIDETPVNCTLDFTDIDVKDTIIRYMKVFISGTQIGPIWEDNTTILTTYDGFNTNDVMGCSGIVGDGTSNATAWVTSTTNVTMIERTSTVSTSGTSISEIMQLYSCLGLSKKNITFYYEDRTFDLSIINNYSVTVSLNFTITDPIDYVYSAEEYLFFDEGLPTSLANGANTKIKLSVSEDAFETNKTLKANLNIIVDDCNDEIIPIYVLMERKPFVFVIPTIPEIAEEDVDMVKYIFYGTLLLIFLAMMFIWFIKKEIGFVLFVFGIVLFSAAFYGIYNLDQTVFKDMSLYISILINTLIVVALLFVFKIVGSLMKKPPKRIYPH